MDGRIYPWRDLWDRQKANTFGTGDGYEYTAPVGSYPAGASPCGALDMAGNVWEWVADRYSESYYASSPAANPQGPTSGAGHVLRGGSWNSVAQRVRAAARDWDYPGNWDFRLFGFRCAR